MSKSKGPFYYKQNRIKKLKAFCATAKLGSISKAAESLFLSQPTISLQIQALEREMNTVLFERRGPRVLLTPAGDVLNQIALPLVDGIENLQESFNAHFGNIESGELNIAAGESTTLYILPKYIKRFANTYPGIQIKLHNVTGRDGMAMLRANEADFAIGSMLEIPQDIIYRQSLWFSHTLITPLDHPLADKDETTLEDICPHGLILPPRHLATWRFLEWVFNQSGLKFKVSMEAGGWEIIKKYVALGLGVSIVTDVCLTGEEQLARKNLDAFIPKRSYGVVIRRGKFLSPQAQAFIDMIDPAFLNQPGINLTFNQQLNL
ncbi:MAG: LysR family transcriptional regulator [Gammaproteobacteria bacterium]|nr:LysR family transcriptional regulator [Gammaproteobacteria bacterium]